MTARVCYNTIKLQNGRRLAPHGNSMSEHEEVMKMDGMENLTVILLLIIIEAKK